MIRTLISLRLKEMAHRFMSHTKAGGKGRKILIAVLLTYCVVVFLGMFGGIFYLVCEPFMHLGLNWLYFALAGLLSVTLCLIGSIFFTQSLIFEAKDNELLLSMPVKPSAILFSRIGTLYLLNLGYSAIINLPCIVVWILMNGFDLMLTLRCVAFMLLLPLLPSALSCVVGFVIALITSRMRNKNIVSLLLSGMSMAAYFYFCFNSQELLTRLLKNGGELAAVIQKVLPPLYALGSAAAEGDILQSLIWIACCVLPMALVYALLSRSFITIATMKRGAKRIKYKAQKTRKASVFAALTVKEMRRYSADAMYLLNGGMGVLLSMILAVVLLIKRDAIESIFGMFALTGVDFNQWTGALMCAALCMLAGMNMLSGASVSIEGEGLWLMQSLPLKAGEILLPKAAAHCVICLPAIILAGALSAFALSVNGITAAAMILLPCLVCIFISLFGVTLNLLFPRFDYASDLMAIKSGLSSGLTMLMGMGLVAIPVILYAFVFKASFDPGYLYAGCAAVLALGSFLLYYYLTHGAQKRFDALGQG
ncbi:MAG: hypothetical protein IKW00_09870 [Clostridia bacterium]|nr:hypothetical protein [Clostridia bacterium]